MKIFYSKQAQEDMVNIYVYISQQNSERVAERVINAIVKTCELLDEYPEMGRRRPELDGFGLEARSIPETSYLIFYTLQEQQLSVARVLHESRDYLSLGVSMLHGVTIQKN